MKVRETCLRSAFQVCFTNAISHAYSFKNDLCQKDKCRIISECSGFLYPNRKAYSTKVTGRGERRGAGEARIQRIFRISLENQDQVLTVIFL